MNWKWVLLPFGNSSVIYLLKSCLSCAHTSTQALTVSQFLLRKRCFWLFCFVWFFLSWGQGDFVFLRPVCFGKQSFPENFLFLGCSIADTKSIKQRLLLRECKWFKSCRDELNNWMLSRCATNQCLGTQVWDKLDNLLVGKRRNKLSINSSVLHAICSGSAGPASIYSNLSPTLEKSTTNTAAMFGLNRPKQ